MKQLKVFFCFQKCHFISTLCVHFINTDSLILRIYWLIYIYSLWNYISAVIWNLLAAHREMEVKPGDTEYLSTLFAFLSPFSLSPFSVPIFPSCNSITEALCCVSYMLHACFFLIMNVQCDMQHICLYCVLLLLFCRFPPCSTAIIDVSHGMNISMTPCFLHNTDQSAWAASNV